MRSQRFSIDPMLKEHQTERILEIAVDRMEEAARLVSGTTNVVEAERDDLVDASGPGSDAAGDNEHS